jgi:hypothetical protein
LTALTRLNYLFCDDSLADAQLAARGGREYDPLELQNLVSVTQSISAAVRLLQSAAPAPYGWLQRVLLGSGCLLPTGVGCDCCCRKR